MRDFIASSFKGAGRDDDVAIAATGIELWPQLRHAVTQLVFGVAEDQMTAAARRAMLARFGQEAFSQFKVEKGLFADGAAIKVEHRKTGGAGGHGPVAAGIFFCPGCVLRRIVGRKRRPPIVDGLLRSGVKGEYLPTRRKRGGFC